MLHKTISNRSGCVSIFTSKPSGIGVVIQFTVVDANGVCIYKRSSVGEGIQVRVRPMLVIKGKIGDRIVKEPEILSSEIFLDNRSHELIEVVKFIGGWNPRKIRKTVLNAFIACFSSCVLKQ